MNTRWMWISLLLLLAQVLTHQVRRGEGPAPYLETRLPEEQWRALGTATLVAWESLWKEESSGLLPDLPEGLFEREASLLKLEDLEHALANSGPESSLARECRAWLQTSRLAGEGGSAAMEAYLHLLVRWCEAFVAEVGDGGRLQLLPGTESVFPDIHFELGGDPVDMGRFLAKLSDSMPWWQVDELAVVEQSGTDWWVMGRSSFQESRWQ
ncbi:MAG: hypothetical protein RL648_1244 [Verrucomicrobiota bacterium]